MPEISIGSRLAHAWNAFFNKDPTRTNYSSIYGGIGSRPDRRRRNFGNDKSIVNAVYTRISVDAAAVQIKHVQLDNNGRFQTEKETALNECLTMSANNDQSARAFRQDCFLSLLDEGNIAVIPTDTSANPREMLSFDIGSMRVGQVLEWRPKEVRVKVYNENTGKKEEIWFPKSACLLPENPFYSTMNAPNSTLKRLIRKLALLDMTDEQNSSGKLDLIIQVPYQLKGDAKKKLADERRKEIEMQLAGSKYGIAYTDATEKVIQLNRQVENQLQKQVEYLTGMLFSQLGITQEILNGTADEQAMLNYNNRTIEPLIASVVDEMNRKWLSKTARSQGQAIVYLQDPFKLVPVNNIAEIADKFTRNAIMTSNEFRSIVGLKPSVDPDADVLRNKNLNQSKDEEHPQSDEENPAEQIKMEAKLTNQPSKLVNTKLKGHK